MSEPDDDWDVAMTSAEAESARLEALRCPTCGCDSLDPGTLGGHGGGACINPECPAGCYEEQVDIGPEPP